MSSSSDADNPLQKDLVPLLALDGWEHADDVDYRNERARCVDAFLDHLLNWGSVATYLVVLEPSIDPESSRRYRESPLASGSDETEPGSRSGVSAVDAG